MEGRCKSYKPDGCERIVGLECIERGILVSELDEPGTYCCCLINPYRGKKLGSYFVGKVSKDELEKDARARNIDPGTILQNDYYILSILRLTEPPREIDEMEHVETKGEVLPYSHEGFEILRHFGKNELIKNWLNNEEKTLAGVKS
ncbi:MAG: hypothetical protein NT129_03395 [Candidatus Aenigmarchaeota archaeon]|nr:hypothetical protein [Candidatus Aenigmarchaeota archaeon]